MENFTPIQNFPDYLIGDMGQVKSLKHGKERTLRPGKDRDGYLYVVLCDNGITKNIKVHRLVGLHWVDNPDNLPELNHEDGNKFNCAAWNLKWTDRPGNVQHAYDTGLKVSLKGNQHGRAKLTPEQVEQIRNLKGQKTQKEIGFMFGIGQQHVGSLHRQKSWQL